MHSVLREKYEWADFMEIGAVKSIYYQHLRTSKNASSVATSSATSRVGDIYCGVERPSRTNSTISSMSDVFFSVMDDDTGRGKIPGNGGSPRNGGRAHSSSSSSSAKIIILDDANSSTTDKTNKSEKYKLSFLRKNYAWEQIKAVVLPSPTKNQEFSKEEDEIILYLTSNRKYKTGPNKENLNWKFVHKDFLVWCQYFTLDSLGKCHFVEREQQSLRDRFKNLTRG